MNDATQVLLFLIVVFVVMGFFLWKGSKRLRGKDWGGYYGEYKDAGDEADAEGLGMLMMGMVVVGFGLFINILVLL